MRKVKVVEYNPEWRIEFERLRSVYVQQLGRLKVDVQHVGSTAVPGLVAKPIIDIDIIVDNEETVAAAIGALGELGYAHLGDRGIPGREALERASDEVPYSAGRNAWPPHHLYVCVDGCTSLRNHLIFRDYLRSNPDVARAYGHLKTELAQLFEYDVDTYCEKKTSFVAEVFANAGLAEEDVRDIVERNTRPDDR